MLALTAPLKARLQALPQLTGWAVRTGTEDADRTVVPAADVRCAGANVPDVKQGAVMVQAAWQVTLVVRRGDQAAEQLDAALSAVICAVHGWKPGVCGGRGWERFNLASVTEAQYASEGMGGYELTFTTAASYTSAQP